MADDGRINVAWDKGEVSIGVGNPDDGPALIRQWLGNDQTLTEVGRFIRDIGHAALVEQAIIDEVVALRESMPSPAERAPGERPRGGFTTASDYKTWLAASGFTVGQAAFRNAVIKIMELSEDSSEDQRWIDRAYGEALVAFLEQPGRLYYRDQWANLSDRQSVQALLRLLKKARNRVWGADE